MIEKDGKYLITKRSHDNGYMPDLWDTPGGTIHYGEAIDIALKREIYEETGLTCEQKNILFVYSVNIEIFIIINTPVFHL